MRLIDADALAMHMADWQLSACSEQYDTIEEAIDAVTSAPTIEPKRGEWIDAVPVRHVHWDVRETMLMHDIKGNLSWGNWYVCTGCGFATTAIEGHITQYKYCPSCGARMDKDGESDEID